MMFSDPELLSVMPPAPVVVFCMTRSPVPEIIMFEVVLNVRFPSVMLLAPMAIVVLLGVPEISAVSPDALGTTPPIQFVPTVHDVLVFPVKVAVVARTGSTPIIANAAPAPRIVHRRSNDSGILHRRRGMKRCKRKATLGHSPRLLTNLR